MPIWYHNSGDTCMTLLEIRQKYKLSQSQVAGALGIPLRTYVRYEKDNTYGNELKRKMMILSIKEKYEITETKGILSVEEIKEKVCTLIETKYKKAINFCFLFGSYAKGYATEKSDVDFCISTTLKGLDYVGLSEDIRSVLHDKKIDLVKFEHLGNNLDLLNEIMKDGIKVYG